MSHLVQSAVTRQIPSLEEELWCCGSIGPLELECEVLLSTSASGEQSLVLYTARPGTDTVEKPELLRVVGREAFADGPARRHRSRPSHNPTTRACAPP